MSSALVVTFFGITVLIAVVVVRLRINAETRSRGIHDEAVRAGLTEPASLHPVIDEALCIGCTACIDACPEGDILGLIDGKARLVRPTHCIGHGACRTACPTDSIMLVFGTEKRGVDIPFVSPEFETNVPGIFIAGELGGMGLIRNAIEQGRQAVEAIRKLDGVGGDDRLDLVIVGAGPAGFSATLAAKEHGLRGVTLEQDSLGGTVAHYPRQKLVMTAPVRLPIVGKVKLRETTKETLLELWSEIEQRTKIKIRYGERMDNIIRDGTGFVVRTAAGSYATRSVLLTIGRRGTPRRLDVPGEELPKVVYRLVDAQQYRGQHVLVVGGGDSALEAAIDLAGVPGTTVSLAYRGDAFQRAKEANRERVREAASSGRLRVLMRSDVEEIFPDGVRLRQADATISLDNDALIVCAGGVLPTPLLESLGIEVQTKHGTA